MPTIAFYTDQTTKEKLEQAAKADQRSLSNFLTLVINRYLDEQPATSPTAPVAQIQPAATYPTAN